MKISSLPKVFVDALPILNTLNSAGYEAYFVGGSIRDLLLERHIHDIDITTNAYPEEVKKLFKRSIDTGIKHGTVTVLDNDHSYEITTFRTESGYQDYRRPDHVEFVETLDEDLKRRDFTINALAMDSDGNVVDLFNGIADLEKRLIRAVGNAETRFNEDALRMMRALRFLSQLQFTLEPKTEQAIVDHHELLAKISVERIREEFLKMMLGKNAKEAFNLFLDTGLSEEVPYFKGKKDLLQVFTQLNFVPTTEASIWAIIIILLKLPNTEIHAFMRAWKNSNQMIREVEEIVEFFDLISEGAPSDYDLYQAGLQTIMSTIDVAHTLGQPIDSKAMVDRYQILPIKKNSDLAVDGLFVMNHGIKKGPDVGKTLDAIIRAIVRGKLANDPKAIAKFVEEGNF